MYVEEEHYVFDCDLVADINIINVGKVSWSTIARAMVLGLSHLGKNLLRVKNRE